MEHVNEIYKLRLYEKMFHLFSKFIAVRSRRLNRILAINFKATCWPWDPQTIQVQRKLITINFQVNLTHKSVSFRSVFGFIFEKIERKNAKKNLSPGFTARI